MYVVLQGKKEVVRKGGGKVTPTCERGEER